MPSEQGLPRESLQGGGIAAGASTLCLHPFQRERASSAWGTSSGQPVRGLQCSGLT